MEDFKKYFVDVVKEKYIDFSGRARRKEFWMFVLFNAIISCVLGIVGSIINTNILYSLYSLAVFLPTLAVEVRRLHDINKSGAVLVIPVILTVVIAIMAVVVMVAALGTAATGSAGGFGVSAILFFVLCIADLVFYIVLLVWFCKEGDNGANQYGEDPKAM